jgi:hypothetical protein
MNTNTKGTLLAIGIMVVIIVLGNPLWNPIRK